jgi:hypothetical protein
MSAVGAGASPITGDPAVGSVWTYQGTGPVWAPSANNVVTPAQFKLGSDPDDTNSIIAALATCKAVELQANVIYNVSRPLRCAGGKQQVFGHEGSVIKLVSTWDVTQHTPCSATSDAATWKIVFYNVGCGGAVHNFVDQNIQINNFTIDASAVTGDTGALIAIFMRNARWVIVDKITCINFADCTAFLASQYTTVSYSTSRNTNNSGFDFWDSPLDATVSFNTVFCDGPRSGRYGFTFNASDTTGAHDGIGRNYQAVGNRAVGCANNFTLIR